MSRPFGAASTTDEVLQGVALTGKRVLVTGASAGLGVETARALVARGAHVVGAVRGMAKARAAAARIEADRAKGGVFELAPLDLSSLANVRSFADALLAAGHAFDVVIANAGVMACPFALTEDGFETHLATNHLGHFVLLGRIAPLLRPGGRVVVVSSAGHRSADVDLEDPNFQATPYDPWVAYGRSKTANILFAVELDRRGRERGLRATALHPGGVPTELGRHVSGGGLGARIAEINDQLKAAGEPPIRAKTLAQGAATQVWAAVVAPAEEVGGRYCEDCHVTSLITDRTDSIGEGVQAYALDPERAAALWARSEAWVGERF